MCSDYAGFFRIDGKNNFSLKTEEKCGIIDNGATVLREAGQGRNPAALSECELCALFSCFFRINKIK